MTGVAQLLEGVNTLGSHPAYQYLSRAYNLNIQSVHFEPNEIPNHKDWHELEHLLSKSKHNLMLWEEAHIRELSVKLSTADNMAVVFNPCANMPENGDFLSIMQENVSALELRN